MEDSGRISLCGDFIRYEWPDGAWELPVNRVRVIGEATTDHGPLADYWLCFATSPHEWHEASFYAAGRDEFLKALSGRLDRPLELDRMGSTNFASRVIWPEPLVGKAMFEFKDK